VLSGTTIDRASRAGSSDARRKRSGDSLERSGTGWTAGFLCEYRGRPIAVFGCAAGSLVRRSLMGRSVDIRAIRVEDLSTIYAINAESLPAVTALMPGDLDRATAAAAVAWVAVVDEAVAGYLIGYAPNSHYDGEEFAWFRTHGDDFLYVDQIAVASPARRCGIGAALYDAVEARARRERLTSLACEVNVLPPNPRSLAFHLRRGFEEVDRICTGDGRRVALFRKQLPVSGYVVGADSER
jgi:uncharacterized protein